MHQTLRGRRGLTLVEVLFVFLIIVVLCALLLPASQSAREAARRAQLRATRQAELAETEAPAAGIPQEKSEAPGAESQAGHPRSPLPRKIIYDADVELTVENFSEAEKELLALVQSYKGYVALADSHGAPGVSRAGTWKVRVPIDRFDAFLEAVVKLGELRRRQIKSQDVTEEYYDLEARIKNKKVEETRLLKHLEESTGKLKDILDVERELSRVREEIERQQGRLQLLANLTSLTTVTINLYELGHYQPAEAPSFGTSITRTFRGSFENLTAFGKSLVLVVVAVAPWLPVVALVGVPAWLIVRRRMHQIASRRRATPLATGAG
jgi:uncharacterized protein DUF4349